MQHNNATPTGRRNHGGLLIIWDRMFGTFQAERVDRKPLYGLNAQVGGWVHGVAYMRC
jgi:sterol desaturase/sphingolipid hydroxylase (fatty acid hydroxylase superfamily)